MRHYRRRVQPRVCFYVVVVVFLASCISLTQSHSTAASSQSRRFSSQHNWNFCTTLKTHGKSRDSTLFPRAGPLHGGMWIWHLGMNIKWVVQVLLCDCRLLVNVLFFCFVSSAQMWWRSRCVSGCASICCAGNLSSAKSTSLWLNDQSSGGSLLLLAIDR